MATLTETVSKRIALENALKEKEEKFRTFRENTLAKIAACKETESMLASGIDTAKIELGRSLLEIYGNIHALVGGEKPIAEQAVADLVAGCPRLKTHYFGNKKYSVYYQRCDCHYFCCPTYGDIVDRIGLRHPEADLTPEQTEAAIYYIMNYQKIKELQK